METVWAAGREVVLSRAGLVWTPDGRGATRAVPGVVVVKVAISVGHQPTAPSAPTRIQGTMVLPSSKACWTWPYRSGLELVLGHVECDRAAGELRRVGGVVVEQGDRAVRRRGLIELELPDLEVQPVGPGDAIE